MDALIWLGIAAVMALVEVASLSLITVWFVAGALVAFAANLMGASLLVQLVIFLLVSILCLLVLRPVFLKHRKLGQAAEPSNIGLVGVVVESLNNDERTGRIELPSHMTWAARSADGSSIKVGETVVVVGQESITLIVERKFV